MFVKSANMDKALKNTPVMSVDLKLNSDVQKILE